MEVIIHGNGITVTEAMRMQAAASFKKIEKRIELTFKSVSFSKNGHLVNVKMECSVNGTPYHVSVNGADFYSLLKSGVKTLEKQIFHNKGLDIKRDRVNDHLIEEPLCDGADSDLKFDI
jgi:ribosome-associated translation inhibitor RaiA